MPVFRYSGIATTVADDVRVTLRSPQYGHPAHRERATGYGPCRHCLRTFQVQAEDRLLFTYQPFGPGSLPAPGPVYIHADTCPRYDAPELPPDLRPLPLVVEGYGAGGRLLLQERVLEGTPEEVIGRAFGTGQVEYVHLRNGEAGCFIARVERCFACD
jgi:hypothetical protein